ncbi:MAG: NADH-quinone oxidoreductase subunit L, partial [Acidobacteriia bacterium]|nr:NADH-quinone oxidoreductase subunit L [Terriglobia bacterium]
MLKLIWLIPVLPLLGVAANGLFGRFMSRRAVAWVACGVVLLSLLLSLGAVTELSGLPESGRHYE